MHAGEVGEVGREEVGIGRYVMDEMVKVRATLEEGKGGGWVMA